MLFWEVEVRIMHSILIATALAILPVIATAEIPCECRDTFGNLHEVGIEVCLTVDGRTFLARCAMAQNVTIWRDTGKACPMG